MLAGNTGFSRKYRNMYMLTFLLLKNYLTFPHETRYFKLVNPLIMTAKRQPNDFENAKELHLLLVLCLQSQTSKLANF